MKAPTLVTDWPLLVTTTSTTPVARAGVVQVMAVLVTADTTAAAPPNVTEVPARLPLTKPVPVMTTLVPPPADPLVVPSEEMVTA